ncbi:MAG: hypothetical protein HY916_11005 [Desulfovibrio sp.]|jgi:hypothetical protein|nr:hypothetical protein [Desulfovibrio sp.]
MPALRTTFVRRIRRVLACCLLACLLLGACSGPVDTVRQARLPYDESVTVEQALKRYPYFTKIEWRTYDDKNGKHYVEAVCDIDVAANCSEVSGEGLKLARRDVARDFFVARFVVDGLPAKVRPLEAQHVTQCVSGAKLVMADPKYLRAIYNREPVRFFCLEGLNCPGLSSPK